MAASALILAFFAFISLSQAGNVRLDGIRNECPFARMQEDYLELGYRLGAESYMDLFWTIFQWHNETFKFHFFLLVFDVCSIWTHIFAWFSWVFIGIILLKYVLPKSWSVHHALFACLVIPTLMSMTSSVCFHTFRPLNEQVYARLASIDFALIALGLCGSQLPQVYYIMNEWPHLRRRYTRILLILGAIGLLYCSIPFLTHPSLRVLRTMVFCAIAVCSTFATLHALYLSKGHRWSTFKLICARIIVVYLLLLVSVIVYIPRFPERFFPGVFDLNLQR